MAQGFLLFFLCGPLSHIHLRINISQRVKVITSTNTWYHRSAKEHIPLKFQLYSSFKTQRRNDCTKSGSRVLTFPYLLPSSVLVHRTSESNCCSVQGESYRYLHFLQLLVPNVLAFSPLLHFHPLTSQSKRNFAVHNNHSVAPHSKYPNFFNTFI